MKKNIFKILSFSLLLVLLFGVFWKVFQYRFTDEDGIEGMKTFYEQEENTIDVMFFGSSHMFVNVNTAVLWDEYGIAAFNLGGSEQRLWNTYYYMKEALKTQHPKVLVVDCYGATFSDDYQDQSGIIKNTFGMKFSMEKIEAVKASAPDNHLLYLLGYPGFHGRYNALSEADFMEDKGIVGYDVWKGHHFMGTINEDIANIQSDPFLVTTEAPMTEKNTYYLNAIIDLAQEEGIPLVLMEAPYCVTNREQEIFRFLERYEEEPGVSVINFNYYYDSMGLNFAEDFADGHHLNYLGTPKFTRELANYLKANYDIPDRRGDGEYADYDLMAEIYFQRVENQKVVDESDLDAYLKSLENENYVIVYTLSGDYKNMSNLSVVQEKLSTYGIDLSVLDGNQAWIVEQKTQSVLYGSDNAVEYSYHIRLNTYDTLMVRSPQADDLAEGHTAPVINLNHTIYDPIYQGLTVLVYDTKTETLVEAVGFYLENGQFHPVKKG